MYAPDFVAVLPKKKPAHDSNRYFQTVPKNYAKISADTGVGLYATLLLIFAQFFSYSDIIVLYPCGSRQ